MKLNKRINKSADKDKFQFQKAEFEKGVEQKDKWENVKLAKNNYTPTYTKFKDIRGKRLVPGKEAEAKSEFLEEVQWKKPHPVPPKNEPRKIISQSLQMKTGKTTLKT